MGTAEEDIPTQKYPSGPPPGLTPGSVWGKRVVDSQEWEDMKATVASLSDSHACLQSAVDGLGEAQAMNGERVVELAARIEENKAAQDTVNNSILQQLLSIGQAVGAKTS